MGFFDRLFGRATKTANLWAQTDIKVVNLDQIETGHLRAIKMIQKRLQMAQKVGHKVGGHVHNMQNKINEYEQEVKSGMVIEGIGSIATGLSEAREHTGVLLNSLGSGLLSGWRTDKKRTKGDYDRLLEEVKIQLKNVMYAVERMKPVTQGYVQDSKNLGLDPLVEIQNKLNSMRDAILEAKQNKTPFSEFKKIWGPVVDQMHQDLQNWQNSMANIRFDPNKVKFRTTPAQLEIVKESKVVLGDAYQLLDHMRGILSQQANRGVNLSEHGIDLKKLEDSIRKLRVDVSQHARKKGKQASA